MIDRVRWYCGNTEAHGGVPTIIREESFYCADIETQLKEVIENWIEDENSRRCGSCGVISPAH
jgi:3-hydroxyanthranilate 3,4-dioxygenase